MRLLVTLALCCHVCMVCAGDLDSMISAMMANTGCDAAAIRKSAACLDGVFATLGAHDTCENFAKFSPCWPPCFCEAPTGFKHLVEAYKPQCTALPACGSAGGHARAAGAGRAGAGPAGAGQAGAGQARQRALALQQGESSHKAASSGAD